MIELGLVLGCILILVGIAILITSFHGPKAFEFEDRSLDHASELGMRYTEQADGRVNAPDGLGG